MIYIIYINGVILPPSLHTPKRISFLSPLLSSFSRTHTHTHTHIVSSRPEWHLSWCPKLYIHTYMRVCVCALQGEAHSTATLIFSKEDVWTQRGHIYDTYSRTRMHTNTYVCKFGRTRKGWDQNGKWSRKKGEGCRTGRVGCGRPCLWINHTPPILSLLLGYLSINIKCVSIYIKIRWLAVYSALVWWSKWMCSPSVEMVH